MHSIKSVYSKWVWIDFGLELTEIVTIMHIYAWIWTCLHKVFTVFFSVKRKLYCQKGIKNAIKKICQCREFINR